MSKIDTILFDLDGTLINTNEIIIESFRGTFEKHFPNKIPDRKTILTYIGPTLNDTFSLYTSDPFLINEMIHTYRELYVVNEVGNFEIYPDVLDVVTDLKEKGYQLGILTSKFKSAAWPSFTHYGLERIFDVFVGLDEVEKPKPDRIAVETALSRFPSVDKALMVGDNQGDILAGKNAEIYSAGVAWSIKGSLHLMEVEPDFMLANMKDIYRVLSLTNKEEV